MISGFNIICISSSNWERPLGNRQQIMSRLAAKNRVLFIEAQVSFVHLFRYRWLWHRIFSFRIKKITDNLTIYSPCPTLPFGYYSKNINLINQWLLLLQLKYLIKRFKFSNILLWMFEPDAYFLVGKLKESISIYHCLDSFKDEKYSKRRKKCIEEMERTLCQRCNLIFATASELLADKINLNKEAYLIPPGVDESFFNNGELSAPETIKQIPRPRIGFIGTLNDRIDYGLIDSIAVSHSDWNLILVGMAARKRGLKQIRMRKNIHFLGWRENNLLPAYINAFDVCIIPYKVNEFTKCIFPIKIFEYLALGRPIVSSTLPALSSFNKDGVIKIANNKEEFQDGIAAYLANDPEDIKDKRRAFARNNTWTKRIEQISNIIIQEMAKK